MTFDHDFGYSFTLVSYLLKKEGRRKERMNSKNRDQKSCLSARSASIDCLMDLKKTYVDILDTSTIL